MAKENGKLYAAEIPRADLALNVSSPVCISSVRNEKDKDDIKPMEKASEVISALKPVTFRYKKDIASARRPTVGLVAEKVAAVNPDLMVQ